MDSPVFKTPFSPYSPHVPDNLFSPFHGERVNLPPDRLPSDDPPTSNPQPIQIQTPPNTPPHPCFRTNPPTPSEPWPGPMATRAGALVSPTSLGSFQPNLVRDTRVGETLVAIGPPVVRSLELDQQLILSDDSDPYHDLPTPAGLSDIVISICPNVLPYASVLPLSAAASSNNHLTGAELSVLPPANPTLGNDVQYSALSPASNLLVASSNNVLQDIAHDIIESFSSIGGSSPPASIPFPITPVLSPGSGDVRTTPPKPRPRKAHPPGYDVYPSSSHRRAKRDPLIEHIERHCTCGDKRPNTQLKRHWEQSCPGNKEGGKKLVSCAKCRKEFVRLESLKRHFDNPSSCKPVISPKT
ncbi:hypothetical protein FRB99_001655 [Tulasnella sp. 403]|nr:hypothetical protein FRB99_001655 [Tulasnella sp. 403]